MSSKKNIVHDPGSLPGYAGKILHLKLSELAYEVIPTEKYREWGGGHGMGAALFWDYCEDKTIRDGRDPKNVCIVAASPFSGTPTPSAGGRCEVVGVGVGFNPSAGSPAPTSADVSLR
jgi:aldehyde:ferredoxin oxidoreductase